MNTQSSLQGYAQQVDPTRIALLKKIEEYEKAIAHANEQITALNKVLLLFPAPGYGQQGALGQTVVLANL